MIASDLLIKGSAKIEFPAAGNREAIRLTRGNAPETIQFKDGVAETAMEPLASGIYMIRD